jgi:parvulin-like peptidyl-prolyl isomerase
MPVLVRVNGEAIEVAAAVRAESFQEGEFLSRTVGTALIRRYAERNNIRNTDQELQLAVDEFRYGRGLEAVDAVEQWLRENNQTALSLQDGIDTMLLNNKVRNSIPEADMRAYFAEHQLEFDQVELYSIRVATEDKAKELLSQIQEEGANFHVLAMEHSEDEDTRNLGGYAGRLTRSQMTGLVEAAVFAAKPGTVIGPVKTEKGWNLFKVAARHKPDFDEARGVIQITLFDQLIRKLRAEATIDFPLFDDAAAGA